MAKQKRSISSPKKTTRQLPRPAKSSPQTDVINPQLQWDAYRIIEQQVNAAWLKLENDVKKRANPQILLEDKNRLMLLLAECNYMARECIRWIDYLPQPVQKKTKKTYRKQAK